jgi:phage terminase large subunit
MFYETTATKKIKTLEHRIRAVSGGASASKTISILIWLIAYSQKHKNEVVSVVSESLPHLRRGAMRDFLNIMEVQGYFNNTMWNATNSVYTFETGTKIEFFSVDEWAKVKGLRRDVLFINEANNISYETYTQLEIRTRKFIWLDWNPVAEFWFYTDVAPYVPHDFLTLTYKDNEALSPAEVESLETHKRNTAWWRVYGEGLLGEVEGQIYRGWEIIDDVPKEAKLESYGLDFGYTNDPTAIPAIYRFNGGYIFDEVIYQKGLTNRQIYDGLSPLQKALIIADSSEPKSIDELKGYGLMIIGSIKGQGSVLQGIQYLQDQKVSVTKRSINLIKEYRNYFWMTDKDGHVINEPAPMFNHMMDALRYGVSKDFVDYRPQAYTPVDVKKLEGTRVMSQYGGVGWGI